MPAREKGNQIKHASVPAAHPAPAPAASERVHGSGGGGWLCPVSHCWGHQGIDVTRGSPLLGQIRVSREMARKWWASSSDAPACSFGVFRGTPPPLLTIFWGPHSLPAPKQGAGDTHIQASPPPRESPPPSRGCSEAALAQQRGFTAQRKGL